VFRTRPEFGDAAELEKLIVDRVKETPVREWGGVIVTPSETITVFKEMLSKEKLDLLVGILGRAKGERELVDRRPEIKRYKLTDNVELRF